MGATMSDTTPDTGTDAVQESEAMGDTPSIETLQAEIDKWKSLTRKHEERAKANAAAAKELDKVRAESMTEQERAVEEAKASARNATLVEVGGRLVAAEIRVAAVGRLEASQLDLLVGSIDLSKFIGDNGEVDSEAVRAFVDGIAPAKGHPAPDLGQGARNGLALGGDPLLQALKNTVGSR